MKSWRVGSPRRSIIGIVIALSILGLPAATGATGAIARGAPRADTGHPADHPVSSSPAAPSCLGAHDLLVDHGAPTLPGGTYDHVCILHGSVVSLSPGAVLRAGELTIDSTSALGADGSPGGRQYGMTDCAGFGNGMPAGSPGGTITILAHDAVVLGRISADGGAGANGHETPCANYVDPGGNGGHGGSVTLKVVDLTLTGTIHAGGGAGGPGQPAGKGGAGGTVLIAVAHPSAAWTPLLSAAPGKNPAGSSSATAGVVRATTLSAADQRQLPAAPPPLTQRIGAAPARVPTQTPAVFGVGLPCGAGDLTVASGASIHLHGVHSYPHVCIQGTVLAEDQLTLLAQTILIAPGALITATDTMGRAAPISPTDPCGPNHDLPRSGAAGAAGADTFGGPGGKGGYGGAAITLVANRMLFAGRAVTNGAAGANGVDGGYGSPSSGDIPPSQGGAGGAGGGISLVASELQLTGTFSVLGGTGGRAGNPVNAGASYQAPFAPRGASGCVRVFADTLRAPAGALAIPGTLFYGHTLPVDPVPPPSPASEWYSAATMHTLRPPFLAFWQKHNGLVIFGYPLSEPLVEQGQTVQYFERSRLAVIGGQVTISPLGSLLTAGRSFPPTAPFADTATRQYFPATRHSLGKPFLDYWRAHDGAALFGPPISAPLSEANGDGSGRVYLVQYFRDARLEYHPELRGTRFVVSIGALGREYLRRKGWL